MSINALIDLKEKLEKDATSKYKIESFNGWQLETDKGIFTLIGDDLFLDGNKITEKEVLPKK